MKGKLFTLVALFMLSGLIVGGCRPAPSTSTESPTPLPTESADTGLANPASVYCEEQGGAVDMREGEGGTYGVCVFPDGSECDEWAYFRGECTPNAEPLKINVTRQAGLGQTVQIDIVKLDEAAPAVSITDPQVIIQIVAALDTDLAMTPKTFCAPLYTLRFLLADRSVQEFGYNCGDGAPDFLRGEQDFFQGQDFATPAEFDALIQAQLDARPAEQAMVG